MIVTQQIKRQRNPSSTSNNSSKSSSNNSFVANTIISPTTTNVHNHQHDLNLVKQELIHIQKEASNISPSNNNNNNNITKSKLLDSDSVVENLVIITNKTSENKKNKKKFGFNAKKRFKANEEENDNGLDEDVDKKSLLVSATKLIEDENANLKKEELEKLNEAGSAR
jgi:hypothetical protein